MNISRAIEIGFAKLLRQAELGNGVSIRPWQSLRADGGFADGDNATFPCVDIRCSPPKPASDAASTMIAECTIICATVSDDDQDRSAISALYGAVQGALDALYAQFKANSDGTEMALFKTEMNADLGTSNATKVSIGGVIFGEPLSPFDDDGKNMIGVTMQVHYSRTDF